MLGVIVKYLAILTVLGGAAYWGNQTYQNFVEQGIIIEALQKQAVLDQQLKVEVAKYRIKAAEDKQKYDDLKKKIEESKPNETIDVDGPLGNVLNGIARLCVEQSKDTQDCECTCP